MSGYQSGNENISSLITSGNTTINNSYNGFPSYTSTNNNWENPSTLGYQISGTDIANSIQAVYTDYTSSTPSAVTPPSWCNYMKIIMIGGGGGGGGGGANDGADENSNNANDSGYRASSGGSGGGGGLLTIITQSGLQANSPTYNITFSGTGDGGAYQGNSGDSGYTGSAGTNVAFGLYSGNDNTPIFNLSVNGGEGGQAGVGTDTDNNDVYGGVGGNYNSSNNVTVLGTIGATGYGGGNSFVGYAGIVTNLGENYNAPTLNTNIDYSSNSNQPAQTNGVEINNTNDVPGYGQGGVGGWNSNNNNGYPGQNGGSALVRVYYMAK